MNAIETIYNGFKFRSRLEARWALFFDTIGIKYQYECEGFKKMDLSDKNYIYYLPDFYLPESKTWVEVKGDKNELSENYTKWEDFFDYGCPLPNFNNSNCSIKGLLLLNDIPDGYSSYEYIHPILQHRKGLYINWFKFIKNKPYIEYVFDGEDVSYGSDNKDAWIINTNQTNKLSDIDIRRAYTKSRQARFEFKDPFNIL